MGALYSHGTSTLDPRELINKNWNKTPGQTRRGDRPGALGSPVQVHAYRCTYIHARIYMHAPAPLLLDVSKGGGKRSPNDGPRQDQLTHWWPPRASEVPFLSRRGYDLSHGRARTTAGASRIRMVTGPGPVAKADLENLVSKAWNKIFKIRNKIFKIIKIGRGHRP